jgi:hypothetical protein
VTKVEEEIGCVYLSWCRKPVFNQGSMPPTTQAKLQTQQRCLRRVATDYISQAAVILRSKDATKAHVIANRLAAIGKELAENFRNLDEFIPTNSYFEEHSTMLEFREAIECHLLRIDLLLSQPNDQPISSSHTETASRQAITSTEVHATPVTLTNTAEATSVYTVHQTCSSKIERDYESYQQDKSSDIATESNSQSSLGTVASQKDKSSGTCLQTAVVCGVFGLHESQAIKSNVETTGALRQEVLLLQEKLTICHTSLDHLRSEQDVLKEAECRLVQEKTMLLRERNSQDQVSQNLQAVQKNLEPLASENRAFLHQQVESIQQESESLRSQLQNAQDEVANNRKAFEAKSSALKSEVADLERNF